MNKNINHNNKVIITCAITGAIHTPTMSPYLPITPDEITKDAIAAAEAGAAILHLHARNPETGQPAVVFLSELDPDVKNLVKSFKKTTITLASGRPYVGLTAINTNRQYDR